MMSFRTKLEGTEALAKKLAKLAGPEIARAAVLESLHKGAEVYAERMREIVPVKTGKTKEQIVVKEFRGDVAALVDSPIAHLVEFGTVKARPRPFVRPAADEMKSSAQKAVADYLEREILKVADQ